MNFHSFLFLCDQAIVAFFAPSTRHTELEGFETYRLPVLSIPTGMLIFRDNYGKMLTPEDRSLLKELLQDELVCHPLTLRLMV